MTAISLNPTAHHSTNELATLFQPSKQDKRFTQILGLLLLLYLAFGILVPLFEPPEIPREIKEQVPAQLAKILLEEKQLPPPEKPKEEPIPEPEPEPEQQKQELTEKPPEASKDTPPVKNAKERAKTAGLAAMKDELFAMREAFDIKPAAQSTLAQTNTAEVKVKRKLIAGAANTQSQALSAAKVGKTVRSDELSTKVTQQIRLAEEEVLAVDGAIAEQENSTIDAGQRSEMSLRRTLEANKARLYALYNRALRKDPLLKGKVMFEIEIQPNGSVSQVRIDSSELNNAKLERQLLVILRSIKFPTEDVDVMTTIWAIDFLPS